MPVTSTSASRTDLRTRPTTDLAYGARGDNVRTPQDQLTKAGFRAEVDGQFGPETLRQLKAFQAQQGSPQSGRVDAATAQALQTRSAPAPTTTTTTAPERTAASPQTVNDARRRALTSPTGMTVANGYVHAPTAEQVRAGTHKLKIGQEGPAVQALQERLNRDLNAGLDADGKFGPRTEAALKQWQNSRGVTDTGVVVPTTQAAFDRNAPAIRTSGTTTTQGNSGAVTRNAITDATRGMTEAQKYDYYSNLAQQNGGQVKSGANQKNIVGLRVPTDADFNGGRGSYDDRFVMFWTRRATSACASTPATPSLRRSTAVAWASTPTAMAASTKVACLLATSSSRRATQVASAARSTPCATIASTATPTVTACSATTADA